jgi:hypothetical protein
MCLDGDIISTCWQPHLPRLLALLDQTAPRCGPCWDLAYPLIHTVQITPKVISERMVHQSDAKVWAELVAEYGMEGATALADDLAAM